MVPPYLPVPDRRLRVGDAERDAAVQALGEHFAAGRLGKDELDARLEAAMAARTYAELDALFPDLPPLHGATAVPVTRRQPAPRGGVPGRRLPVPMLVILLLLAIALEAPAVVLIPLLLIWFARRPATRGARPSD